MPDDANERAQVAEAAHSSRPPRWSRSPSGGKVRVGHAAALATGALVTASIGVLEHHMLASPHPIPSIYLFLSDTIYMKMTCSCAKKRKNPRMLAGLRPA
jgi:hypothetical protein